MMQTAHAHETSSVNPSGPSMERRQRRVLALVEHMALIDQLINIFEQGGGTCDLRNGTKVFPWTTLPAQLAAKQLYFTGWPECCLPRPSGIHRNAVDPASDPMWWSAEQRAAMRAQIDAQQISLCRRTPQSGEAPFIFEFVDIHGAVRRTLVGFSTKWYHRMGRPGSGFMLSASTSQINGDSVQPEFLPSTSFLDTYFHSLGSHGAPASASSPSPPAVKQEEGDNEMAAAEPASTTTSIRTLPQHLESRLRRLLEGIPNKVLPGKRRRASSSHSSRAHSHRDGAADGEKENALREWAIAAHGRSQNEERPTKKRRGEQHPGSSSSSSLEEANVNYSPAPSLHVLPYHTQPDTDAHAFTRGRDPISRKRISKQPRIAISARVVHGPSPTPAPMNPSPSPLFFHQGQSHSTPSLSYPTSSPFSHTPPASLSPSHALPTPTSQPTLARSIHQRHQRFNSGTSPAGYIPPRDHGVDVLPISPFSPAHTHSPFSPVPSQSPFTPVLSQSPSFTSPPPEDASR